MAHDAMWVYFPDDPKSISAGEGSYYCWACRLNLRVGWDNGWHWLIAPNVNGALSQVTASETNYGYDQLEQAKKDGVEKFDSFLCQSSNNSHDSF